MDLRSYIRDIPDFPKKGIVFKDITPLLGDGEALAGAVEVLASRYSSRAFDKVVAVEARGFILGAALAYRLKRGFVPVRKPGKLPARTVSQSFQLEYGQDTLEIHQDALRPGERVLIVDDVLATGGTLEATAQLVEKIGGQVVEIATLVELTFLKGRERIAAYPYYACVQY